MESLTLSPVGLFIQAGPVGKTVIVLLGIASVWCWFQIFDGTIALVRLGRALAAARANLPTRLLDPVVGAGIRARVDLFADDTPGDIRARMSEAMSREARAMIARLEGGLPNLAVIASVAPFVGLFGTVWGIMTSFRSIAASKNTSLAVVAPGIAEALFATAIGLFAAIPALIFYNILQGRVARTQARMESFADEFSSILS
eukprot:gene22455-23622_t